MILIAIPNFFLYNSCIICNFRRIFCRKKYKVEIKWQMRNLNQIHKGILPRRQEEDNNVVTEAFYKRLTNARRKNCCSERKKMLRRNTTNREGIPVIETESTPTTFFLSSFSRAILPHYEL